MARGAGIVFIGTIIARIFGYSLRVALKRYLGLDDFGLVATGVVVVEISSMLALMGLQQAVARFIAYHRSQHEYDKVRGTLKAGLSIGIMNSLFIAVLVYFISSGLAINVFHKPGLVDILHHFWLIIPLYAVTLLSASILRGFKNMAGMIMAQQVGRNLFVLIAFGTLALLGFKLTSAIYGYLIGFFLTALVSALLAFRTIPFDLLNRTKTTGMTREILMYSWPLVFATLLWFLIGRTDTLFLASYVASDQVGIYNAVLPLAQFVLVTPQSFAMIFMPLISGVFAQGDRQGLRHIYLITSKWLLMFTLPIYLPIVIFAKPLLVLFFGPDTAPGTLALQLLATGFFVNAIVGPASMTLSADAKTKLLLLNTTIAFMINIFLNILLVPKLSIIGSAWASSLANASAHITAAIESYFLYRILSFRKVMLKVVTIAFVSVLLTLGLNHLLHLTQNLPGLFLISGFLVIFYLTGLLLTGCLDQNDLTVIEAIEGKFGVKFGFLRRFIRRSQ